MRFTPMSTPPTDDAERLLYEQSQLVADAVLVTPGAMRFGIPIGGIALGTASPSSASIDELTDAGLALAAEHDVEVTVASRQWAEVAGYPALEVEGTVDIGAQLNWAVRAAIRAGGMMPIHVHLHLFDRHGIRHLAAAIATHRASGPISEAYQALLASSEWQT
jgi:hypothetical protein